MTYLIVLMIGDMHVHPYEQLKESVSHAESVALVESGGLKPGEDTVSQVGGWFEDVDLEVVKEQGVNSRDQGQ